MKKIILLHLALALTISPRAQATDSTNQAVNKAAIKNTVEAFLTAAGNYDVEANFDYFFFESKYLGSNLEEWKVE